MQHTNQEPLLLIPARKSHFEQELRDDEERWALHYFSDVSHAGFRAFREMQISLFTATVYPDALLSPLLLTHRWMIWGFLLDDLLASADFAIEPANVERFLAPLLAFHTDSDRSADSADPFYVGFIRFFQQITPYTSPTWRSRFLEHNRAWLSHSIWESENRARGTPPDESEYPSRRLFSSGAFITTDLLEPCLEIELPPEIYNNDLNLSMLKHASLVMCFDNDLFSWTKESGSGEVNNLIAIFKHHQEASEQEAKEWIEQLICKELEASLEAAHQLLSRFSDHQVLLSRYISGIQAMITGVLAWHRTSTRYASERGG